MKYILYARKSTDREDRQVQSLDDQVKILKSLALKLNIKIIDIYREAKSAKDPYVRPLFTKLIQNITRGEVDGIICWKIDRLSRNSAESGLLMHLLQKNILKSIQTNDREYKPEDNVLLLSVETGISNQYILDLKKNVKRGLNSKIEKGWKPCFAPLGYLNDKENKTIIRDPERFDLVRKMFDFMLTGNYTPPRILDMANKQWGLKTRKCKKLGGKELSKSAIYNIFTNIFYAGILEYDGSEYKGSHPAMINLDEFDQIQSLLGRKGKPRPKKHEFSYTGIIKCGECGCYYTAQENPKKLKNGQVNMHTYYHCTRRKTNIKCNQTGAITKEDLDKQIEVILNSITILPEFRDWALDIIKRENHKEVEVRTKIYQSQQKAINEVQKKLDSLIDMRCSKLIDDNEYSIRKEEWQAELKELQRNLRITEERADKWLELTEQVFNFATNAREAFRHGDVKTKRSIFKSLGQTFIIKDKKLTIELNEWFKPIQEDYPLLEERYLRLKPTENVITNNKNDDLNGVRSEWLGRKDSNPRMPGPKPGALPLGDSPMVFRL